MQGITDDNNRKVAIWLLVCCALVFAMVVLGGVTRLTVTHELEGAPIHASVVGLSDARLFEGGGGWPMILSDLKTLLETGSSFVD